MTHNELEKLQLHRELGLDGKLYITDETPSGASSIYLLIQNGPRKEVGSNGADIDALGLIWKAILLEFDKKFPCKENKEAIKHIESAISWQHQRMKRRLASQMEGFNIEAVRADSIE